EGYNETIKNIDRIKAAVARRTTSEELKENRQNSKQKIIPIEISEVVSNQSKSYKFITKSLYNPKEKEPLTVDKLEKRFFRLAEMDHIGSLYPTLELKNDSTYRLHLKIREA